MSYEFTPDGFNKFSDDIISANGEQGAITSYLNDMRDTMMQNIAQYETMTGEVNKVTEENKRLMAYNMDLYKQLGEKSQENFTEKEKPLERGKNLDAYLSKFYEEEK